ncbi:hypothetical protein BDM02DRAFT_3192761 [Thelephora ganbajun]|uniref:Uncharacterized protein n=1 Tax=Thelephora ganbajun TaxID=370292 RepID=A0ACB6YZR3_THEGA|nr:hypothetical protein BDM02DRAFT_3192761 [Thelephora ganbajun]
MSILGPCMLEFRFSPETEWVLTSHHRVLVVLLASPFHKRRFLRVASRKSSLRIACLVDGESRIGRRSLACWGGKNAVLEREVEGLKQRLEFLSGEFGVLQARVEALEWVSPSEYLSAEDLLRMGGGGEVEPLESDEAAALGLRADFQDLVVQPDLETRDDMNQILEVLIQTLHSPEGKDEEWMIKEAVGPFASRHSIDSPRAGGPDRNNRVERELHELKGQVALINSCLLAINHFLFDANSKVNTKLKKDGERLDCHQACVNVLQEKHNGLVMYVTNQSDQLELQRRGLIALCDRMCHCNTLMSPPVNGSGGAPSFSHSPPSTPPRDLSEPLAPLAVISEDMEIAVAALCYCAFMYTLSKLQYTHLS